MSQISINNLTFSYPGSPYNIFENVNLTFDTDWKIGFVGRNGRGKTTFLNLLMNKYEYNGTLYRSLSGVAKAITGALWNGKTFFGITTE